MAYIMIISATIVMDVIFMSFRVVVRVMFMGWGIFERRLMSQVYR